MTRRDRWLGFVSVCVGPLIGSLAFMLAASGIDAVIEGNAMATGFMLENWPIILTAGSVLGAIPGLVFAIIMAVMSRRLPALGQRLLAAAIVGALAGIVLLSVVLFGAFLSGVDWVMMASLGLTGAVAGLVSMGLIELFHPLPAPPEAAS